MLTPWSERDHLGKVQEWAEGHGVRLDADTLPSIGYLANDAAAGWLFLTDSRIGLMESFVTNPKAPLRLRRSSLDEVGAAIIEKAHALGITRLITMTPHRALGSMAIRRGFTYLGPMHVLTLEG